MKEGKNSVFNYKLQKEEIRESRSKSYPSKHFATSAYSTQIFYKNITRLFIPVEIDKNEK